MSAADCEKGGCPHGFDCHCGNIGYDEAGRAGRKENGPDREIACLRARVQDLEAALSANAKADRYSEYQLIQKEARIMELEAEVQSLRHLQHAVSSLATGEAGQTGDFLRAALRALPERWTKR